MLQVSPNIFKNNSSNDDIVFISGDTELEIGLIEDVEL